MCVGGGGGGQVWAAQQQLSWLATAIGRPEVEAKHFTATAARLKEGILGHLARPATACDPPVGSVYHQLLYTRHAVPISPLLRGNCHTGGNTGKFSAERLQSCGP